MTNNFFCNYFIQKTTPVYLNFCWELLNNLDLKKEIAPHNIRNASIMYRLCFQIADIQFDVAASNTSLKETHKKPLFQMPRFRFIRNNEQCQLLPPVPALLLCELSNQHVPSFPVHWKSSQLSWPLWPVLCPSLALRWCYCKVHANVPCESCRLWCTLRKEKKAGYDFCVQIPRLAVRLPFFKHSRLPLKLCMTKPSHWLIVRSAHSTEQNGLLFFFFFWRRILQLKCQHG